MNDLIDTSKNAVESSTNLARRIKQWDDQRPDFPGEHLIVAAAGLALLAAAGKSGTPLKKLLLTAAGTAALTRAASGRGGIAKIAGWMVGK